MKLQFLPQAIPFYAAQRSFDLLAKERPDYTFRQPADNPTNPADRPADWEKQIIQTFQAHPEAVGFDHGGERLRPATCCHSRSPSG